MRNLTKQTHHLLAAAVVAVSGLIGCAATQVLSTWKAPDAYHVAFQKVLVIAPGREAKLRRTAEDAIVAQIKRTVAVPSYTIIPDAELGNDEQLRARAKAAGFDGAVVMRVVAVDREAVWVPGTWTGPYYAIGGWPDYYGGYLDVNTFVRVETNVYSVADDRLLWASASRTENPSSVHFLVKDTAKKVVSEMREQGFLAP
jgi:hypothetical protein